MIVARALAALTGASAALAQVTVYGQIPLGQTASTAAFQTTTIRAAYNTTRLSVPALPEGAEGISNDFVVQLAREAGAVPGISIPHEGASFYGFSIEMSVINQVRECHLQSALPSSTNREKNSRKELVSTILLDAFNGPDGPPGHSSMSPSSTSCPTWKNVQDPLSCGWEVILRSMRLLFLKTIRISHLASATPRQSPNRLER
jgi:hypothetical protein